MNFLYLLIFASRMHTRDSPRGLVSGWNRRCLRPFLFISCRHRLCSGKSHAIANFTWPLGWLCRTSVIYHPRLHERCVREALNCGHMFKHGSAGVYNSANLSIMHPYTSIHTSLVHHTIHRPSHPLPRKAQLRYGLLMRVWMHCHYKWYAWITWERDICEGINMNKVERA